MNLNNLIRPNIQELTPYSSARDEFTGSASVFLDANENPYGTLNRYPDPHQQDLKQHLATLKGIAEPSIFIGNGSDELIDLTIRLVCEPGQDRILQFSPTYGMYQVSAKINNVAIDDIALTEDFQIDWDAVNTYVQGDKMAKLAFICSPNNPTANAIEDIEQFCALFSGLVFIDEAYIDFSSKPSLLPLINSFNNVLISQTMSKAWGLAAARVGVGYGHQELIAWLNSIKPPYNVSELNQKAAIAAIQNAEEQQVTIKELLANREQLKKELLGLSYVKKIYPSDANFLLLEVDDADKRYDQLIQHNIVVRNRNRLVANCLRITVGSQQEIETLIKSMIEIQ